MNCVNANTKIKCLIKFTFPAFSQCAAIGQTTPLPGTKGVFEGQNASSGLARNPLKPLGLFPCYLTGLAHHFYEHCESVVVNHFCRGPSPGSALAKPSSWQGEASHPVCLTRGWWCSLGKNYSVGIWPEQFFSGDFISPERHALGNTDLLQKELAPHTKHPTLC